MACLLDDFTSGSPITNRNEDKKAENVLLKEFRAVGAQITRACAEEIKTQSTNALKDMKRELRMVMQDALQQHSRMELQKHSWFGSEINGAKVGAEPPPAFPLAFPAPLGETPPLRKERDRGELGHLTSACMTQGLSGGGSSIVAVRQRKAPPPLGDWDVAFDQPEAPPDVEIFRPPPPLPNEVPSPDHESPPMCRGSHASSSRLRAMSAHQASMLRSRSLQEGHADAGAGGAKSCDLAGSQEDEEQCSWKDPSGSWSGSPAQRQHSPTVKAPFPRSGTCGTSRSTVKRRSEIRRLSLGMHKDVLEEETRPYIPFYKMSAADLLGSSRFDNLIGFLILLNAATIGWQADFAARNLTETFPAYFSAMERIFCSVFSIELMLRIYVYKLKFFCGSRKACFWNYFDLFVVSAQLTEEVITIVADSNGSVDLAKIRLLRVLRILRLVRILRVVRVLHLISELRTIISSIIGSFKSLGWTVVLLFLIIYIVGVFFTNFVTDHLVELQLSEIGHSEGEQWLSYYFGSLFRALLSLWQAMSGGADWDSMAGPLINVHWSLGVAFAAYIAFALLALMNVVTGVFVQTALQNAKEEEDLFLTDQIVKLFEIQDRESQQRITFAEIEQRLRSPDTARDWKAINVRPTEAKYLFDLLDINESGEIQFEEFLSGCLRLHGTAKSFDLLTVMQEQRSLAKTFNAHSEDTEQTLENLRHQVMAINSFAVATSSEVERVAEMVCQSQDALLMMDQRLQGQEASLSMIKRIGANVDRLAALLGNLVSSSGELGEAHFSAPPSRAATPMPRAGGLVAHSDAVEV